MKQKQYNSLGVTVNLNVPESVEEFDQNAKRIGACLDEAINNVVYRGSLAEFRDAFTTKVEETHQVERKTESTGKKDSDGNDIVKYAETEGEYIKRVCATKGIEAAQLQSLADEVAAGIVFDASATERKPAAPKKLAEDYKNVAIQLIDAGKVDAFRDKKATPRNIVVPDLTGDREKDILAVGYAVKQVELAIRKEQMAALVD